MDKKSEHILLSVTLGLLLTQTLFAADSYVTEFGITGGKSVSEGFVFLDGKYLEAPYVVSRRGLQLFVNDRIIQRPVRHPGGKPFIGNVDPNQLSNQERQKLFRELEATRKIYENYLEKGYCYWFSNQGGHIRLQTYVAAYRLPGVIQLLRSNKYREDKLKELIARNWHLSVNIEPLVDNFSASGQLMVRLNNKAQELLRIEEFGVTIGELVDEGFIFLDGQYLDAPYVVTRKGLGVFINNKMIEEPIQWPVDIPSGDADPMLPPEINSESSIYDEIVKRYMWEKQAYLSKHTNRDEEARLMEQAIRNLPFVTDAYIDEKDPHIIHFTTTEGLSISQYLVSMRGRKVKYDRESVLKRVESKRRHFQDAIKKGSCYFLFRNGGRSRLSANSVAEKLPRVVEVLRSGESAVRKFQKIKQAGLHVSGEGLSKIVTNFSASPQLEARLSELTKPK